MLIKASKWISEAGWFDVSDIIKALIVKFKEKRKKWKNELKQQKENANGTIQQLIKEKKKKGWKEREVGIH